MLKNKTCLIRWKIRCAGILALFCLAISQLTQAKEELFPAKDRILLNIGISFAIPPWVIPESNSGIELDILREAFKINGYAINPNYLSFALSYSLFEADKLDGILNVTQSSVKHGFYSEPVLHFQNVAVSLKEKRFPADIDISFLADKSIVAFQKASVLLGEPFSDVVSNNLRYQEVAKQSLQINLLMIRDVDFIIMEKNIFGYYWQKALSDPHLIRARSKLTRPVQLHYLFEPTEYRFVFATEKIRDDFNDGLKHIKINGLFDDIFKRYAHLTDLHKKIIPQKSRL
jgi:polar amino acid transport system substrate-binding protein